MGKESYLVKIIKFLFVEIWRKISWTEIIIICILMVSVMTFIKVNVATYHVECSDGSIVEVHHGLNQVCDREMDFNAWTGRAMVLPVKEQQIEIKSNFNLTIQ